MEEIPAYVCSECQKPVIIVEGEIIRGCTHTDAAVLANLSADTFGIGSMQEGE